MHLSGASGSRRPILVTQEYPAANGHTREQCGYWPSSQLRLCEVYMYRRGRAGKVGGAKYTNL